MENEQKPRQASCACGQLRVECSGEPVSVSLCHCLDCQRRTGSAFGIAAFYDRARVRAAGEQSTFCSISEEGFDFKFYFCPACGGTVYWETTRKPDYVAVAAGAFADPHFPPPERSHFDEHRHRWLDFSL